MSSSKKRKSVECKSKTHVENRKGTTKAAAGKLEERSSDSPAARDGAPGSAFERESNRDTFQRLEEVEFKPRDFRLEVFTESIEASVGYSSLIRQLNEAFRDRITYFRSPAGGSMSFEDARKAAFKKCEEPEEALKIFNDLIRFPVDTFDFNDLGRLWDFAPRSAEHLWEIVKNEARKEFESGHLATNAMFPVSHMKEAWKIAKYLGIRESFVSEWEPKGGIEVSLVDMLAQSFFLWQYWIEQVVLRSQTRPRREHHEYQDWKQRNERTKNAKSWEDGYWFPPYVDEQEALEHATQMADRWNRIYMRTLRQLRDLRRYSPVTINNANQVNIAADGGQQVNLNDK